MSTLLKKPGKKIKDPYISCTKLAEYQQANATRRTAIIKNLRTDNDFHKLYYSQIKTVIPSFIRNGYSILRLDNAITRIGKSPVLNDWEKSDKINSLLALETLKASGDLPDLSNYDFVRFNEKLDYVIINGVKVTLKPELFLQHRKTSKIGAIKLHYAKTVNNRLNDECKAHVGTLLKHGLVAVFGYSEKDIDNKACICIDVFSADHCNAPTAFKRTLTALGHSCDEIAARWDTL